MFTRPVLQCPKCRYDVTASIDAGFRVCPECGGPVSEDLCDHTIENLPVAARRFVYMTWLMPILPGAAVMTAGHRPPGTDAIAGWLVLVGIGSVYAGWWWVERWEQPAGSAWRAVGTTLATLLLDYAAAMALALTWVAVTR